MAAIPSIILVFDVSALSAASCSEWREFARVGSCYLPQVVYEEMKMMFDRSPDPDLERIAKDFHRFYASSNWIVTQADAHHAALKMGSGQSLTRRARVSLAVGRSAYALSQSFQSSLVVLVTKDRSLLQRLYEIPEVNLCGITGEALLQWSRSGSRPIAVIQKIQQFRTAHGMALHGRTVKTSPSERCAIAAINAPKPAQPTLTNQITMPEWLPDAASMLMALVGLAIAGYLIQYMVQLLHQKYPPPAAPVAPTSFHSVPTNLASSG
ncbi:MAG: hypothetical protein HC781_16195 [Leptolyngbyaceae cyanobacterium CSU_1_4]|nr:hypothetical protein [Leptolyngbyaceae cyanobacterium CSU_1_4]